ncbi:hypothetical protein Cgig2_007530 [Carnegiea gigantea]|uniref:Uncharacterized protein n=1 Tax=Carnegiea gigantea TaxID=171969 RepID=A0A9Q1GVI0_9CARY|nr:hypothetical protein Cgig2_007530 [Carnegiea gigantea]
MGPPFLHLSSSPSWSWFSSTFCALNSIYHSHLFEEHWSPIPVVGMDTTSHPIFSEFSELEIREHSDDYVRSHIMKMHDSRSVLAKSQLLKDEGNRLFRTRVYPLLDLEVILHLGMIEEAHNDLLLDLQFDPSNDEVKELLNVEQLSNHVNSPMGQKETKTNYPIELPPNLRWQSSLIPLNLGNSSQHECSSQMSPQNGVVAKVSHGLESDLCSTLGQLRGKGNWI